MRGLSAKVRAGADLGTEAVVTRSQPISGTPALRDTLDELRARRKSSGCARSAGSKQKFTRTVS